MGLAVKGSENHGEIVEVWESYGGDLWVFTEVNGDTGFGYARLSAHPQFAEWGTINRRQLIDNQGIWKVERRNWRNIDTYDGIELTEV